MFAHIYAARPEMKKQGHKFELMLTPTCEPRDGKSMHFASKNEAKAEAKRVGAKAWNF